MLTAPAYTFRKKSRLSISLSWVAGYTNVVGLIALGQTVSHQTGNTSRLGLSLGDAVLGHPSAILDAAIFGSMILLFCTGAIVSGAMTELARYRGYSSRYLMPITLEGIMLGTLLLMLLCWPHASERMDERTVLLTMVGVGAFAMGLQNATITRISGAVVRTTHLTGVVTDFGLELVAAVTWWREMTVAGEKSAAIPWRRRQRLLRVFHRQSSVQRVALLASIFGSFLLGAFAGAVVYNKTGAIALLAPLLFLSVLVLSQFLKPIGDIRPVPVPMASAVAIDWFTVSHRRVNSARQRHHAPDFFGWIIRLPREVRCVALCISAHTQFDDDTAASLGDAIRHFRQRGGRIVVVGLNAVQSHAFTHMGFTRMALQAHLAATPQAAVKLLSE